MGYKRKRLDRKEKSLQEVIRGYHFGTDYLIYIVFRLLWNLLFAVHFPFGEIGLWYSGGDALGVGMRPSDQKLRQFKILQVQHAPRRTREFNRLLRICEIQSMGLPQGRVIYC